ncbi:MAG: UpxY family transcription antiterminator [Bacteroidota bacterium]
MSVATATPCSKIDSHIPKWFAIYTRFKCEKRVCQELERKGVHAYVPLQTVKRQYTKKVKTHHLPLISCYVFVKITQREYISVLETDNVVDFVRFAHQLIAIPEQEIHILKRVTMEPDILESIEANASGFEVGDKVEIIAGNLTGLKGKLLAKEGKKYMVVELEQLGYFLQLKVATQLLNKVENQPRMAA